MGRHRQIWRAIYEGFGYGHVNGKLRYWLNLRLERDNRLIIVDLSDDNMEDLKFAVKGKEDSELAAYWNSHK